MNGRMHERSLVSGGCWEPFGSSPRFLPTTEKERPLSFPKGPTSEATSRRAGKVSHLKLGGTEGLEGKVHRFLGLPTVISFECCGFKPLVVFP